MKHYLRAVLLSAFFTVTSSPLSSQTLIPKWGYSFNLPCTGFNVSCYDIKTDLNGNHIATGTLYALIGQSPVPDLDPSSTNAFPPAAANYSHDFYVSKYDPAGNFISAFIIGGSGVDAATSIAVDNLNNIVITGFFNGTMDFDPSLTGTATAVSNGGQDLFVAKYTTNGVLLWVKTFGSTLNDVGTKVITDNQNNIFLSANFRGTIDIDPSAATNNLISGGGTDVCIAKFDPNGNLVAAASFGGSSDDANVDMVLDPAKKLYITGSFGGTVDFDSHPVNTYTLANIAGPADIYICKFDSLLSFDWAKSLVCSNASQSKDINIDNTGNILLSGNFFSNPIDLDPSATSTVNFAAAVLGGRSAFIAKYDANGGYLWAGIFGSGSIDGNNAVSVWSDNSGNVYSTGYFTSMVDFDLSPSASYTITNNSGNGTSLYYAKYDNAGNFISAIRLTNPGIISTSSHADVNGDLLFSGHVYGNINIDPTGSNPYIIPSPAGCGNWTVGFISKYTSCVLPTVSSVTASVNNVCPGTTNTLSVTGNLNSSANWSWSQNSCGAASIGTGSSIVVTMPQINTVYYVKGIGGCGGANLGCTSITITPLPVPQITLTNSTPNSCPGRNFTLTASGAPNYTWSNSSTTASIVASASVTTIFSVSSTATNGCVYTKTIAATILTVQPLIQTLVSGMSLDSVCPGNSMVIKHTGGSPFNWSWLCSCQGSLINNELFLSFNDVQSTVVYTVVSKDNVNQCDNSKTYTLTVIPCTSLQELNPLANKIRVFPNPAGSSLWIEHNEKSLNNLRILSLTGQLLLEYALSGNESPFSVPVSDLKPGLYLLEIRTVSGLLKTQKIIKE